jgi:hypothetical protein
MNRFVTPDEAEALSAPAVQRAMRVINEALCNGERRFMVLEPLLEPLCAGLRAAGWVVEPGMRTVEHAWFAVSKCSYAESYLERMGARVIAMRGER